MNQFPVRRQEGNANLLYKEHKRKRDRGAGEQSLLFSRCANLRTSDNLEIAEHIDTEMCA